MEERMSERLAGFDVDYSQGVLTLKLGPEHGTFVINKQPANKQIWFSSPLSGPKRFEYDSDLKQWVDIRANEQTLHDILRKELKDLIKVEL
ncbi:hypothetical protein MP638_000375 [Amoeboaphelidium occidentale]|nr:hypothetical protein MP638_000375 [Amoeboaphelidium occidentale]